MSMSANAFVSSSKKTCKDYCTQCESCSNNIPLIVLAVHMSQCKRGLVQIR